MLTLLLALSAVEGLTSCAQADPEKAAERLAAVRAARPEGAGPRFDAWDRTLFDAEWELGRALLRRAEAADDRAAWTRVSDHFTDLVWRRDETLGGLEARIPLARARQALGDWRACYSHLAAARRLETPEQRKDPDLVGLAARATTVELRARAAQGRGHEISLQTSRGLLKQFPEQADSSPFVGLRLETGRCLAAAGRPAEAVAALEALLARAPDDALEALAELSPVRALEFAELLFERRHYTEAAWRFAKLRPRTSRCWLRIGQCYLRQGRFHEALAALEPACAAGSADRLDAALAAEQALARIVDRLGETALKPKLDAHRAWMRDTWPLEKAAPEILRSQADALRRDGKYAEAADLYGKIGDVEASRARGYCRFRLKDWEGAVADFRRALAATPGAAGTTADLAAWALLHLDRPAEVLELTAALRQADPVLEQWRRAHRADALARLGRFEEALAERAGMDEAASPSALQRALERLAAGLEASGDPKWRGACARVVVELSEKSFRPLSGPRLLAAADALAAEGGPAPAGLALDLYLRWLAAEGAGSKDRRTIEFAAARSALAAGRLEQARTLADAAFLAEPQHGGARELLADVQSAQARALPGSPERGRLLDVATAAYGSLSAELGAHEREEAWHRVTVKYAAGLAERDPGRARRFFAIMEKRGYGDWDGDRWGARSRMRAIAASLR